ncbi:hypothetical protein DL764_005562 [Monosporascus ibericus]|uniref:Uncharacterized protein n=1 Tax=Monosporascus ibericus TaxID=155417 RepID=A0A4Q4TAI2_9PEZI|nr:hypothetical protein DL764_005562 [Monosporascus ibericus]
MRGVDDHAQLTNRHLSRPREKKLHRRDQANGGFRYPNSRNTAPFRGKNNSNIADPFPHPNLASWTGGHTPHQHRLQTPGAPRRGKRNRRPHPRENQHQKRRRGRSPNGFAAVPFRRDPDDLLLVTTTCPSSPAPTLASSTGGGRGHSRSHGRTNQQQQYSNRPPRPQLPLLLPPSAPPHQAMALCTECRDVRRANARFRDWAWGRLERAARRVLDWSAAVGVGFDAAEEMDWQPEPLIRVLVLRAPSPPPPPPPSPGSDGEGGDGGGVGVGPLGRPHPPLPGYWRACGGSGDGFGEDGAASGHPGTAMGLGSSPGVGGRGEEDGGLGPGTGLEGAAGGGGMGGGYYARRPPPPYVMSMMQNPVYHHPGAAWAWGGGPGATGREGGAPDMSVIASTWYQPREPAWTALTSPENCGDIC